ncbi:MAG: hypothetical protein OXH65_05220 [Paracoccaceae bacterium]|nr:hypothetical protein [Paracoccaceae bacterium]
MGLFPAMKSGFPCLLLACLFSCNPAVAAEWNIPLPLNPLSDDRIAKLVVKGDMMTISAGGMAINGHFERLAGYKGGLQAENLHLVLPSPAEAGDSVITLQRVFLFPVAGAWQLEATSLALQTPFVELRIDNPSYSWNPQGGWHFQTGRLYGRSRYAGMHRPVEILGNGFNAGGNPSGWKGKMELVRMAWPLPDPGFARGELQPLDIQVNEARQFLVAGEGGWLDPTLAGFLFETGPWSGNYLIRPFRAFGQVVESGEARMVHLQGKGMASLLDIWFGEIGFTKHHLNRDGSLVFSPD